MKKTLLILLLSLLAGVSVQAQTVYQFELENSARTMGNSMAGFVPMRLATFKNAALVYMQRKADAAITPSRDRWLDNQAYHLADFLTLYQIEVTDQNISEADHARLKMMFRDATLAHPAFVDRRDDLLAVCQQHLLQLHALLARHRLGKSVRQHIQSPAHSRISRSPPALSPRARQALIFHFSTKRSNTSATPSSSFDRVMWSASFRT